MVAFDFNSDVTRRAAEAAYAFRDSTELWAKGVQGALAPTLDAGLGTLLALVALPPKRLHLDHLSTPGAARYHQALVRLSAWLMPGRLRASFFSGRYLGTSSQTYSSGDFARLESGARGRRARDAAGFCVNDSADYGLMIVSPLPQRLGLPLAPSRGLRAVARHVATGLRFQRAVSDVGLQDPAIEAILEGDGTVCHAQGMARATDARARLRAAVAERGRTAAGAAAGAEDAWGGLCAGRWSLVDRFDTDGRRFVVAYRNPEGVVDPRRLTPREDRVTTLASLGKSNKEIAAELGISDSTVASLLGSALRKLGLGSRTLLPLFRRDLATGRAFCLEAADARLVALESREASLALPALTPAERAVARGVLAGWSDRDISRHRGSSERTVARQVAAVFRKLGVSSRAELASKVAHLGTAPGRAVDDPVVATAALE